MSTLIRFSAWFVTLSPSSLLKFAAPTVMLQ
jgi:hypothetical protein